MKKILYMALFMAVSLIARSDRLSDIPLPQSTFFNADSSECGERCLKKLVKEEQYFSFLANYQPSEDREIEREYQKLGSILSIERPGAVDFESFEDGGGQARLAILVPQKSIRRYAMTSTNSIIAYLMARNSSFDIEVFNTYDESEESLSLALAQIRQGDYKVVVAPVTPKGARFLSENVNDLIMFIPTINAKDVQYAPSNILFGGIDYEEQIQKLLEYSNPKIATFSDGSSLSAKLSSYVSQNSDVGYAKSIASSEKINLKYMLKGNRALQNASIFLNMPLVKSSLLASQLRVYEIKPHALLSTQINYHPMLLSLTQYPDRKRLYLANSISKAPLFIEATNELFGHSITHDWVNYSTNAGMDYLYAKLFTSNPRVFKEQISENQLKYNTKVLRSSAYGFYEE